MTNQTTHSPAQPGDLPYTEAEFVATMKEAFTDPQPIQFETTNGRALVLVSLLQFAERGLPDGHPFKRLAGEIGRHLTAAILTTLPDELGARVAALMDAGWNPAFDQPAKPSEEEPTDA